MLREQLEEQISLWNNSQVSKMANGFLILKKVGKLLLVVYLDLSLVRGTPGLLLKSWSETHPETFR